jgi:syndecan 4
VHKCSDDIGDTNPFRSYFLLVLLFFSFRKNWSPSDSSATINSPPHDYVYTPGFYALSLQFKYCTWHWTCYRFNAYLVKTPRKQLPCLPCDAGNYLPLPSQHRNCDSCPAGEGSSSGSSSCHDCGTGKYSAGAGDCQNCPMGKYSTKVKAETCSDCPKGKYSSAGSSQCGTECPSGTFPEGSGKCDFCPIGKFSTEGDASCSNCASGTSTEGKTGQSSCAKCPPGTNSSSAGGICQLCPDGTFQNLTGSISCMTCPNNTFSHAGKTKCVDFCDRGYYGADDDHCTVCPAGRYGLETGLMSASQCVGCMPGKFSMSTGATNSSVCENCPSGRYGPLHGMPNCKLCDPGEVMSGVGLTASNCSRCGRGNETNSGQNGCITCPAGTANEHSGGACEACPLGTYSDVTASYSFSDCKACPAGKSTFLNETLGTYFTAAWQCSPCSPGKYASTEGSECMDCPLGSATPFEGSSTCSFCPAGKFAGSTGSPACTSCEEGYYSVPGSSECTLCSS